MSGPVTYSVTPFASTVLVGDQGQGAAVSGASPTLANARQFGGDSLDDGTPAGRARADAYIQKQIDSGAFKKADIDRGDAIAVGAVDSKGATSKEPVPGNDIPANFDMDIMITDRTRLRDFVNTFVAIPNCKRSGIPAQCGLTQQEIVGNLSKLCKNVWEPIKDQYPNAIITNNLRVGDNIGAGPHGTGQAMDIQFNNSSGTSIPPSEYFAIAQWIRDNISFNQLLLEYSTSRGFLVAWIHIAVQVDKGRNANKASQLMTFMNHKTRCVGLTNLA